MAALEVVNATAATVVANLTEAIVANLTSPTVIDTPVIVDPATPVTEEDFFWAGLTQSFLLVFLAEIGDKTFIMVMLLANKMNKVLLWIFATIAMNIMNAISVTIGAIFPLFMPKMLISIVVIALFFTFGLKMLYTGLCSKDDGGEDELEEAKETLERLDALNEKKEPLLGGTM
jgi:hypothetical protein